MKKHAAATFIMCHYCRHNPKRCRATPPPCPARSRMTSSGRGRLSHDAQKQRVAQQKCVGQDASWSKTGSCELVDRRMLVNKRWLGWQKPAKTIGVVLKITRLQVWHPVLHWSRQTDPIDCHLGFDGRRPGAICEYLGPQMGRFGGVPGEENHAKAMEGPSKSDFLGICSLPR